MWTGNVSPYIPRKARSSKGETRPLRNLERRAARRKVHPGFPVDPRPFTYAEIQDYFAGVDVITCLRCGRSLKRLAMHLERIHSMKEDEYREMYGLPWSYGLVCMETNEAYSQALRKRIDDGEHWFGGNPNMNRDMAHRAHRRPMQPFQYELAPQNLSDWRKAHPRKTPVPPPKLPPGALRRCNTSGFQGVSHHPGGLWNAKFRYQGIDYQIGYFKTFDEAKAAYIRKREEVGAPVMQR
jgi:hypothetical protein